MEWLDSMFVHSVWQVDRHGNGFHQLWSLIGPTVGCVVYEKTSSGKLAMFSITMALDNAEFVPIVWMKEYPKTVHKVDGVGGRRATISRYDYEKPRKRPQSQKAATAVSSNIASAAHTPP
jgi:hypothetical protein